jgi:hypothetical protein
MERPRGFDAPGPIDPEFRSDGFRNHHVLPDGCGSPWHTNVPQLPVDAL